MRQASEHFNEEQRRTVEHAVVEAERKTSAEIVPEFVNPPANVLELAAAL